jgi:hypothetical protein
VRDFRSVLCVDVLDLTAQGATRLLERTVKAEKAGGRFDHDDPLIIRDRRLLRTGPLAWSAGCSTFSTAL